LNALLQDVQKLLKEDKSLSRLVKYNVKEKGQNEKTRLANLLRSGEPDLATIQLLDTRHDEWIEDPSRFWHRPAAPSLSFLPPPVQIVGCYLQTRDDDT